MGHRPHSPHELHGLHEPHISHAARTPRPWATGRTGNIGHTRTHGHTAARYLPLISDLAIEYGMRVGMLCKDGSQNGIIGQQVDCDRIRLDYLM